MDIKAEILRRVEALPLHQLLLQLSSAEFPPGEPGTNLLPFSGTLDAVSAREMADAIEAGCEHVDPDGW